MHKTTSKGIKMKTATDLIKELAESRNKEEKDKAEKEAEENRIRRIAFDAKLLKPFWPLINIINEAAIQFKDVVEHVSVYDDYRHNAGGWAHYVTFSLLNTNEYGRREGNDFLFLSLDHGMFSVKKFGGYDMRYGTGSYDAHKTMFSAKSADELIPGLISLIADRVRAFEKGKSK